MSEPNEIIQVGELEPTLSPEIQQAIASLHLEGITLSDRAMADLALFSQGVLSKEEAINRCAARCTSRQENMAP